MFPAATGFAPDQVHLMGGANRPWIIAADPNGEGVDLDSVMPIIPPSSPSSA